MNIPWGAFVTDRYIPPPLMSPEDRRKLIEAPIGIYLHGSLKSAGINPWANHASAGLSNIFGQGYPGEDRSAAEYEKD